MNFRHLLGCDTIEYIKLDTCAKFHDHWSNNKVIMGALMPPPPRKTDSSEKAHVVKHYIHQMMYRVSPKRMSHV